MHVTMLMISLESPDVIKIMDTSIIHPNILIKKKNGYYSKCTCSQVQIYIIYP